MVVGATGWVGGGRGKDWGTEGEGEGERCEEGEGAGSGIREEGEDKGIVVMKYGCAIDGFGVQVKCKQMENMAISSSIWFTKVFRWPWLLGLRGHDMMKMFRGGFLATWRTQETNVHGSGALKTSSIPLLTDTRCW